MFLRSSSFHELFKNIPPSVRKTIVLDALCLFVCGFICALASINVLLFVDSVDIVICASDVASKQFSNFFLAFNVFESPVYEFVYCSTIF
jgi:hypothetical protein